ncbi:MAG TPA: type II secretion system protein [Phycisphaerae bacterium]|nr:type II secretion system protein [Phycisphaerae bacterium]
MTRGKPSAFSLIELLIAIALLATLLTAVAVAVNSSVSSYTVNERLAEVTQTARSVLERMAREIRTASAADGTTTRLVLTAPADGSGLTQAEYELVNGTLYYRRTTGSGTTEHPLIASTDTVRVSSFNVQRTQAQRPGGEWYTASVTVTLTLSAGGETFPLTSTATLRRNQTY